MYPSMLNQEKQHQSFTNLISYFSNIVKIFMCKIWKKLIGGTLIPVEMALTLEIVKGHNIQYCIVRIFKMPGIYISARYCKNHC